MVYYRNGYRPFPRYYGLGEAETKTLRRLPPRLASIVANELDNPDSVKEIAKLLREPNPAQALARELSRTLIEAMREDPDDADYYFDEVLEENPVFTREEFEQARQRGLGNPGFFDSIKRVAKKAGKPFKKVYEWKKKIRKKFKKVIKPFIPIIVGIAGAVLAPFTGGASLAAAAAINAGIKYYDQRKAAKAAVKAQKKEAGAMQAEANRMEKEVEAKADKVYEEEKAHFLRAGITQGKWDAMSVDEKITIIQRIANGMMPATPQAAAQAGQEQGFTPGPKPTFTQSGYPSRPPREGPPTYPPTDEEIEAPVGTYELYVEGRKVGEGKNLQEVTVQVGKKTSPGDRFEVFFNGKSTGLKIRTPKGAMSIPPDQVAQVKRMSRDEVQNMVIRATATAHEKGKGIPWGLVVVPAVAVVALSA